jgi:hypothetical protein
MINPFVSTRFIQSIVCRSIPLNVCLGIVHRRMTDSRGIASETVPVSEVSHEDLVFWIV